MEVLLSDNSIQYPGSDPQIDDPYKGICIVHAIYKGSNNFIDYSSSELKQSTRSDTINPDILKSELTKIDTLSYDLNTEIAKLSINNKDIFYHDFNNFFPDKQRIYRGSGFIRTLNNKQYVITCNHIMVKYASYVGYCTNVNSTIICFNMIIYKRIPELDIVIMEISSKLDYPLPDIPFEYPKKINKMTEKETHNHNILISGEYNPNNIEKPVFKKIELNTDIIQEFDILKSTYIHDIPIISIPVHEILSIKKILNEYKLDITQYLNITFLKKQNISQKIADVLSGTSGSIIRSNNNNIGMCCLYADSSSGIFLKALPLFLIDIIVKNTIFLNQNIVLGIQVDTYPCDIEYMKEHFYAQYVELAGRMFGAYMNYTWNPVTKKLQIIRDPKATGENVLLWTYNLKPEVNMLQDFQISQWIRDYMVANCKMIIGEAREKFGTIAGPQGGGTLNGTAMKAEAQTQMDGLLEQLKMYVDGSQPLTWVIG